MAAPAITLTTDQATALSAIHQFLLDPIEPAFVLTGFSGTGKTTLVQVLLAGLPKFMATAKLLNPTISTRPITLTATTNKAAENLSDISGEGAGTIHKLLGLRVITNYQTGVSKLVGNGSKIGEPGIVVIDEASLVDSNLLQHIFQKLSHCKVIFIGDPAQLTQVKATSAPVFNSKFPTAALTEVVRQAKGNPIMELATSFRRTVESGQFFTFIPDGDKIQHLTRDEFNQKILHEFGRSNWAFKDSKVLSWTNKCAIGFNNFIRAAVKGNQDFVVGDYAVSNSFLRVGRTTLKADQEVRITAIGAPELKHDVMGMYYTLNHEYTVFMALSIADKNKRISAARAAGDTRIVEELEEMWVDLRASYAQTVNKSQGSTYGKVFMDLDDIRRCNSGEQIARMMYVGVSRARTHLYLVGDLA